MRWCLDSLCLQDLDRIEFILVDDGSPDCCGEICDEYARKDDRFRVFHKENGGLSSARNYGIDHARGEYLMFVDSDDWVTLTIPDHFEPPVRRMRATIPEFQSHRSGN